MQGTKWKIKQLLYLTTYKTIIWWWNNPSWECSKQIFIDPLIWKDLAVECTWKKSNQTCNSSLRPSFNYTLASYKTADIKEVYLCPNIKIRLIALCRKYKVTIIFSFNFQSLTYLTLFFILLYKWNRKVLRSILIRKRNTKRVYHCPFRTF